MVKSSRKSEALDLVLGFFSFLFLKLIFTPNSKEMTENEERDMRRYRRQMFLQFVWRFRRSSLPVLNPSTFTVKSKVPANQ